MIGQEVKLFVSVTIPILLISLLHTSYSRSAQCLRIDTKVPPTFCSDICPTFSDPRYEMLRHPIGKNISGFTFDKCYTFDAFPSQPSSLAQFGVHVRLRRYDGMDRLCALGRTPLMVAIGARDKDGTYIGKFISTPLDQNISHGCLEDENDVKLLNNRFQPGNLGSNSNVDIFYTPCPSNPDANAIGINFELDPTAELSYCGLWTSDKPFRHVSFVLEVGFESDKNTDPIIFAQDGNTHFTLSFETPLFYYDEGHEGPGPTISHPTACHDPASLIKTDSLLAFEGQWRLSDKCKKVPTYTEPCTDLCIPRLLESYPRIEYNPSNDQCFSIAPFPIYKPDLHIHVRVRFTGKCPVKCCSNREELFIHAVDENWNPIGLIEDEAVTNKRVGVNSICSGEDSGINNIFGPGKATYMKLDCDPPTPDSKIARAQLLNVNFGSYPKPLKPNFCFVANFSQVADSTYVRFILEMKVAYSDKGEPFPPVRLADGERYIIKAQSKLYLFQRPSKPKANQVQSCHDWNYVQNDPNAILRYLEDKDLPLKTTTTMTTTTAISGPKWHIPALTPTTTTTATTTATTILPSTTPTPFKPVDIIPVTHPVIEMEKPRETEATSTTSKTTVTEQKERARIETKIDGMLDNCEKTKKCKPGFSPICSTEEERNNRKKRLKIEKGQSDCVKNKNCEFLLSYGQQTDNMKRVKESEILLQMSGRSLFWIAIGFSEDDRMGDDFVVECVWSDGEMFIFTSWNYFENGIRGNTRMSEAEYTKYVRLLDGFIWEGKMYCSFALQKQIVYGPTGRLFDFGHHRFKSLMAIGNSLGPNRSLTKHGPNGALYSPVGTVYGEKFGPSLYQEQMINWHGMTMWMVWLVLIPISNLMARHYKETFQAYQIFGIKIWLVVHVSLSSFGLLLIFVSHGFLTEANNSWHSLVEQFADNVNYHLWFSLACSSLYFFNMLVGCIIKETLRGQDKRGCFSCPTIHKCIGHGSYAIGMASLYTSPETLYSHLPCSIKHLVVAWIAIYHIYLFVIMEYHSAWINWLFNIVIPKVQARGVQNPYRIFQDPQLQRGAEAPGSRCRQVSLVIFCVIAFGFCIKFLVLTSDPDQENACFGIENIIPSADKDPVTVTATCNVLELNN